MWTANKKGGGLQSTLKQRSGRIKPPDNNPIHSIGDQSGT